MNSYIAAVRKCGRMLSFFLLLLLILGTAGSHQARANGVVSTIGNGQVVYGSVSGTNYDTYSFPVPSGAHVVWTVTATTAYNSQFMSEADVYKPGGGFGAYAYGYYFGGNDYATGANPEPIQLRSEIISVVLIRRSPVATRSRFLCCRGCLLSLVALAAVR